MNPASTAFDWQSWAALGVVALTVMIFVVRLTLRKKSGGGCGTGCGCGTSKVQGRSAAKTEPADKSSSSAR